MHQSLRSGPLHVGAQRVETLEQSDPNLVQLIPAAMLSHLSKQDREALPPVVTSGFVCNKGDVFDVLKNGAAAISTRDSELWNLDPER
ncbi:glycerol-3-phosphate responsive antiterminator [Paraburkholderia xenovorans]|uniref:glycerol-3-phosphate responsive antiterminator n=1 Tax=Paraburkholderia xenovorans TaxID=36873 RepID=UPI0038BA099F